ncbi:5287_t:CDS:2 [Racocetra fulgida]|uniref:5287_t:CDS:1 n=1 Tax=Racocetra fulgida TaxID=60492 RepID=A0A9N9FVQ6_9GLOM|nr:5287_t:CDS:2 [Racocetra fulgida]
MSNSIVFLEACTNSFYIFQATVYRSVINDVIENVKKDFEDSGVDDLKVTTWDSGDSLEELSHNGNISSSVMTTSYSHPPPNDSHPKAPSGDFEVANLPILASSTLTSNDYNGMGKPQPHLSTMKNGNSNPLSSTSSTNEINPQVFAIVSHPDAQTPPPQQLAYDSSRKETRRNESYGEEDDINSDLDDSDDDGNTEGEETQNIILCLYDKVTRTKNKWKCQLKDGIMSVNGRDYLFQKGNGDFEF